MQQQTKSIRPFIGAKNFEISRRFYNDLGFEEVVLMPTMSYFEMGEVGFYLQDAAVKDWIDNTMVFLEVEDVEGFWNELQTLDLVRKYPSVKMEPIRYMEWGKEFFVHDPSGILWHVGAFNIK